MFSRISLNLVSIADVSHSHTSGGNMNTNRHPSLVVDDGMAFVFFATSDDPFDANMKTVKYVSGPISSSSSGDWNEETIEAWPNIKAIDSFFVQSEDNESVIYVVYSYEAGLSSEGFTEHNLRTAYIKP